MRILLATFWFAVAGLIFSFFIAATVEAVTSWGVQDAFVTMFCFWQNLVVFVVLNILGTLSAYAGVAIIKGRSSAVAIS